MAYAERPVSRRTRLTFPILVTLLTGFIAPQASPLIGMLMFGNLMRESGVVDRLVKSASNELANITTLLLGVTIGATMVGSSFANVETLIILVLGVLAFALDTAAGVLFGKLLYGATRRRFNPLVGAAGISAFPMSARVVQRVCQEDDNTNFLLMHATGANTAGQIASVMAGGIMLALMMG
jgi:oxaloacetate decarboxylase beta subunit